MSKKPVRTLEQLNRDNYENLTFGEMCEYNLDCSFCPLNQTYCFCEGGMVCYGGMPIEPMCCSFNEDDVLQDIYDRFVSQEYTQTKAEEEREKQQKLKEEKSKQRKQKLHEYRFRNCRELEQIKLLKLKIKREKERIVALEDARRYISVTNSVNKIFGEANQPYIKEEPFVIKIKNSEEAINQYLLEIAKVKEVIAKNEKEFKKGKTK